MAIKGQTKDYRVVIAWDGGTPMRLAHWTEGAAREVMPRLLRRAQSSGMELSAQIIHVPTGRVIDEARRCDNGDGNWATGDTFGEDPQRLCDTCHEARLEGEELNREEAATAPAADDPVHYRDDRVTLYTGDALAIVKNLPDESVNCVVTSPPYYHLRDYGHPDQYGLEPTPDQYVESLRALFHEIRRVLADDGTVFLNIGDSYNSYPANRGAGGALSARADRARPAYPKGYGLIDKSLPNKSLLGIPWRTALALQQDGWIMRNVIIWNKSNALPETANDRFVGRYEPVFMFAKKARYSFDATGITEDGSRPGDVWDIPTHTYKGAHFAVMPTGLATRAIQAGCVPGGTVLDPFSGSGTTATAALSLGRRAIGIDLSASYNDLAVQRISSAPTPLPI